MDKLILGLDIGGANLKLATNTGIARIVPFALWKQPDKLSEKLATMIAEFPDAEALAVTMTGESCDCYETKREGGRAILRAVHSIVSIPTYIWLYNQQFYLIDDVVNDDTRISMASSMNWHALTVHIAREYPQDIGMVIDIGSTTTDLIRFVDSTVWIGVQGDDVGRMMMRELIYCGVERTPVCAFMSLQPWAAELFATTGDVYRILNQLPENPDDTNTADNRPATCRYSHSRLARMMGGDHAALPINIVEELSNNVKQRQLKLIRRGIQTQLYRDNWTDKDWLAVISGCGEFLAREALQGLSNRPRKIISLSEELGPELSTVAPAYALTQLLNQADV